MPTISSDGRYVVFETLASNLVPGDTNRVQDIVIKAIPNLRITSVLPNHLPIGATTAVTIKGKNFLTGATPLINTAQISNVVIVDEGTITVDVTVPATASRGARNVLVNLYGTGPGAINGSSATCNNCVTFQ